MARIVNKKKSTLVIDSERLSEEEKLIASYIHINAPNEDYSEIIQEDNRYITRYNLSDYRSSIIRWYPFKEDATVLEIGAEYGAITGALCDQCKSVCVTEKSLFRAQMIKKRYEKRENLDIYVGDIDDYEWRNKFDYIVCLNNLEYIADDKVNSFLKRIYRLLRDDGILLLSVNNTYSINNLIGECEVHSGIPFDSIAGYPNKECGRGYNKAELSEILDKSPFTSYKYYYPMPDYIAPRALFSDDMMPDLDALGRLMIYHRDTSTLVAPARKMYEDAIKNGVYDFVVNTFLLEVSKNYVSKNRDIKSVYLSGNKRRDKSFATIIYSNRNNDLMVRKKCLYEKGAIHIQNIFSIMKNLESSGIAILPMKFNKYSIDMKYISSPTVQHFLNCLVENSAPKEDIIKVFDIIWDNILRSSPYSEECSFDTEGLDVGIILRDAYIEMIISNCFWNNGDLVFFDQEYVCHGFPALYILYRNIYMSYSFINNIESIISEGILYERYGINNKLITVFEQLECKLGVDENPEYVFCRTDCSEDIMKHNRLKLKYRGENGRFNR